MLFTARKIIFFQPESEKYPEILYLYDQSIPGFREFVHLKPDPVCN